MGALNHFGVPFKLASKIRLQYLAEIAISEIHLLFCYYFDVKYGKCLLVLTDQFGLNAT